MYQQTGKKVLVSAEFKKFFKENEHWLLPYAAFSYLRDQYGTPNFSQWPEHNEYHADEIAAMCIPESDCYEEIAFIIIYNTTYTSNYWMPAIMHAKRALSLKEIFPSESAAIVWKPGLSLIISI